MCFIGEKNSAWTSYMVTINKSLLNEKQGETKCVSF